MNSKKPKPYCIDLCIFCDSVSTIVCGYNGDKTLKGGKVELRAVLVRQSSCIT